MALWATDLILTFMSRTSDANNHFLCIRDGYLLWCFWYCDRNRYSNHSRWTKHFQNCTNWSLAQKFTFSVQIHTMVHHCIHALQETLCQILEKAFCGREQQSQKRLVDVNKPRRQCQSFCECSWFIQPESICFLIPFLIGYQSLWFFIGHAMSRATTIRCAESKYLDKMFPWIHFHDFGSQGIHSLAEVLFFLSDSDCSQQCLCQSFEGVNYFGLKMETSHSASEEIAMSEHKITSAQQFLHGCPLKHSYLRSKPLGNKIGLTKTLWGALSRSRGHWCL